MTVKKRKQMTTKERTLRNVSKREKKHKELLGDYVGLGQYGSRVIEPNKKVLYNLMTKKAQIETAFIDGDIVMLNVSTESYEVDDMILDLDVFNKWMNNSKLGRIAVSTQNNSPYPIISMRCDKSRTKFNDWMDETYGCGICHSDGNRFNNCVSNLYVYADREKLHADSVVDFETQLKTSTIQDIEVFDGYILIKGYYKLNENFTWETGNGKIYKWGGDLKVFASKYLNKK